MQCSLIKFFGTRYQTSSNNTKHFTDEDYEPSSVNDVPVQQAPITFGEVLPGDSIAEDRCATESLPSTSKENLISCTPTRVAENKPNITTPKDVRPYQKAVAQAKKGSQKY